LLALERERASENEVCELLFTYVPPAQMYQNALIHLRRARKNYQINTENSFKRDITPFSPQNQLIPNQTHKQSIKHI